MPEWVRDHDLWEKAKKAAKESGQDKNFAIITSIYKKMGGRIKTSLQKSIDDLKRLLEKKI